MLIMTAYWEKVAARRELLGMSREELARAAELTVSYIFRIEKGKVLTPSLKTYMALARGLKTTLMELIDVDGPVSIAGDDWEARDIRRHAPNTPIEEAREVLSDYDHLDSAGKKAVQALIDGLRRSRGSEGKALEG